MLSNILILLIVAVLLFAACRYIYKEKKKGRRCIGCPMSGSCPKKCIGKEEAVR
ncbi:MAG: FeoB-associated Cys-rich membrane protein [Lachnospiraceae bacterium]|nr:FeoB-associated Cys-rich membrane protein [Lachnospiraceae bacterium]